MPRAIGVIPPGQGDGANIADTLLLDHNQRNAPRGRLVALRGTQIDVALKPNVKLRGDDRLTLDDGRLVEIVARPEPLLEIRAADPARLARAAWMLGDRHILVEIAARRLRVRADPAIATILDQQDLKITAIEAPFEPEGGAYDHVHQGQGGHHHD